MNQVRGESKRPERAARVRWRVPAVGLAALGLALAASLATAPPARAQVTGSIAIRWDACYSDGGSYTKRFDCDTNAGVDYLVVTARLSEALPQFNGATLTLHFIAPELPFPSWWQFQSGGCHAPSPVFEASTDVPTSQCLNPWPAGTVGGTSFVYPWSTNDTGRFRASIATPPGTTIEIPADQEIFVCRLAIPHSTSTGPGACSGCSTGMCVGLVDVTLYQPLGVGDYLIRAPYPDTDSDMVSWQDEMKLDRFSDRDGKYLWNCRSTTPTRTPTWGAVKALYR